MLIKKANQEAEHSHATATHYEAKNNWVWKNLWRCRVPPKVRVFWWRVINEFIPSRVNLHHRHIEPMDTCATCEAKPETTYHALLTCSYAQQFWKSLSNLTDVKMPDLHPITWSLDILDEKVCTEHDKCLFLCGMWSLWNSRNDRKHGKSPIPVRQAIDWALDVCFHLVLDIDRKIQSQTSRSIVQWQKPEASVVKINTDGSFHDDTLSGATWTVIRDDQGIFLKASVR
jgi:hypothetical protein